MGHYHTAQICLNGHVITSHSYPDHRERFCSECGEATTTQCETCATNIRGYYEVPGFFDFTSTYSPPNYCHSCGRAFPWTARKLQAARELADEIDELSDAERQTLKLSLDDLTRDTPRTELASTRFKKVMRKVSKESYEAMKSIVTDVVSETVKKTLFDP